MANIDAGKLAGIALLIGGIGWFAWKIPKGREDWKPFFTAGLGLMSATLGAVILFRKIPTADIGWIDLTQEEDDEGTDESVNLKVTAAAEYDSGGMRIGAPLGTIVGVENWRFTNKGMKNQGTAVVFELDPGAVEELEEQLMEDAVCPVCNKDDKLADSGFPHMMCSHDHTTQKGEYHHDKDSDRVVRLGAEHRGRDLTPAAKKYVSDKISEIIRDWQKTGRIGSSRPKTLEQAQKQAVAVAYSYAKKAGHKIPKDKIHYM